MQQKAVRFALFAFAGALAMIGLRRFASRDEAAAPAKSGVAVYVFLAEDCVISQSATLALKSLHREFQGAIDFVGVFANASSTVETVAQFRKKYEMPFGLKLDDDNQLLRALGARVTPEVFAVEQASQKILYKGRIDDSFARVGQRRSVVTSHELQDALAAIVKGDTIAVKETQAIGCFITRRAKAVSSGR